MPRKKKSEQPEMGELENKVVGQYVEKQAEKLEKALQEIVDSFKGFEAVRRELGLNFDTARAIGKEYLKLRINFDFQITEQVLRGLLKDRAIREFIKKAV